MRILHMTWRDWWYWGWAIGGFSTWFWCALLVFLSYSFRPPVAPILVGEAGLAAGLVAASHVLRHGPFRWWAVPMVVIYAVLVVLPLADALSEPEWIRIGWQFFLQTGSFYY